MGTHGSGSQGSSGLVWRLKEIREFLHIARDSHFQFAFGKPQWRPTSKLSFWHSVGLGAGRWSTGWKGNGEPEPPAPVFPLLRRVLLLLQLNRALEPCTKSNWKQVPILPGSPKPSAHQEWHMQDAWSHLALGAVCGPRQSVSSIATT